MLLNLTTGVIALRGGGLKLSVGWNSFVAAAGTLMPIVWPRFLAEGLATWPHIVIFIWFAIFFMELPAFVASWTWYSLDALPAKP